MLNEDQTANLKAFAARIVPDDDGTPGALVAGVDMHIRALLVRDLAPEVPAYRTFLDALGTDFATLSPTRQDAVLQGMELSADYGATFRRMAEHVQEGFYISPVAWRLIGWEVTG